MTTISAENSTVPIDTCFGFEHVLAVDDNGMVRDLAVHQLISLGYKVSEAMDGPQALRIIREYPDIDMLFTDMEMPGGMSGRDLAEAARQLRPELTVLLTSGSRENIEFAGGGLDQDFEMLPKPYRRGDLAQKLREMFVDASDRHVIFGPRV